MNAKLNTDTDAYNPGALSTFSTRQIVVVCIMGLAFWWVGALSVRFLSPLGFFGPTSSVLAFAAAYPVGWFGVWVIARLARLHPAQVVPGIALGTIVATSCDGVALTWVPWLYGSEPSAIVLGAGWILWGAAAFFAAAFFEAHRMARR